MSWTVPANGRHTSGYGPRNTGIPGASTYHRGHDIAPPKPGQRGVTVHAAGPGVVAAVDTNTYRGRYIRIRHDDRSMTLYQHLDDVDVRFGQRVTTGQRIGLMGSTGVGAGVHLHFECYEAGVNAYVLANAVDPVAYLARRGVRLVEASTVSKPLPIGGALPGAPGGTLPDPLEDQSMSAADVADLKKFITDVLGLKPGNNLPKELLGGEAYYKVVNPVTGALEAPIIALQTTYRYAVLAYQEAFAANRAAQGLSTDVDEKALAEGLAPLLVPALVEAVGKHSKLTPEEITAATEQALRNVAHKVASGA